MDATSDRGEETWPGNEANAPPQPERAAQPVVQLADSYLAQGVFTRKALKIFEDAAAACPDRQDFQEAVSICCLIQAVMDAVRGFTNGEDRLSSVVEQRDAVERLFGQFPRSPDLAKCLGDVRLLTTDWDGACHAYRLAQSKGYRDEQAIVNSGRAALGRADCPASVLMYFGELALSLGQFSQAARFLTEALRRSRGERDSTIRLLEMLAQNLIPRLEASGEKQMLLSEVVRAWIDLGGVDRALAAFRQMDPASGFPIADLVKPMARHLIDQEDYRQAFDYLSRIPLDRDTKNLVNEITVKLEQRGEIDTAVYLLQFMNDHDLVIQEAQKIADDQLESTARRELANLCFRSGRYDDALSHYLHLIREGTSDVTEFADRIETAVMQMGKPAVEDLLCLGEFFFARSDWRRAEVFLNRAFDAYPDDARVREMLRAIYDNLLKAEPNLGRVRLRSGDLHLAANRIEDAIGEYQKVLQSPGYEMEARRRLANAHLRAGKPALALEQYRGLALRASDLEFLYDLHENLMSGGMFPAALEAASMICDFDSRYRDVEDRVAQLEQAIRRQDQMQSVRDPKMIELIGEQAVGRYRYVEQIGSGGMGVVHKVYDMKNQVNVAMKILRESLTGSSKAIDRFFREARIAATLSHPNIVNIFDYNINNVHGKSYISMEFVDGPSLRDIIEKRFSSTGELNSEYIAEILFYTAQLCDALETTHLKGIIHRDIKPDNIMIASNRAVKITDFGIVHIEEATFTPTGALIGTPRYMSPEQVRGGRVDCRSDIYAVGIIMYESLIGNPPFITGDIAYQHVNVSATPPRTINPFIPEEVEAIITRCLQKDPRHRYQRAKDLKEALESVLDKLYPKTVNRFSQTRSGSTATVETTPTN